MSEYLHVIFNSLYYSVEQIYHVFLNHFSIIRHLDFVE